MLWGDVSQVGCAVSCREKLESDEEFELVGVISEAAQTNASNAENGNEVAANNGLSYHHLVRAFDYPPTFSAVG